MTLAGEGMWEERGGPRTSRTVGDTSVAVVCCLHGDEVCGRRAIERVVAEYGKRGGVAGVKFVLANPRAYERGRRFVDEDLNRAFPGDLESDSHERRLAARLLDELRGHVVLDLHSTVSDPTPFALFQRRTEPTFEAVRNTGLDRVLDIGFVDGGLIGHVDGVSVEFDKTDRERATEEAYETVVAFLGNYGLVDAEGRRSDPTVYRIFDEIPRERDGFDLLGTNFERVTEGDTFARREGAIVRAEGTFYPVLASERGYEERYGFKAAREGRLSEWRLAHRDVSRDDRE